MPLVDEQPKPKKNDGPAVWDMVIQDMVSNFTDPADQDMVGKIIVDMKDRDEVGFKRYGTRLQPFNGRHALIDAYQEFLDGAVYLRQFLEENQDPIDPLIILYNQHLSNMLQLRKLIQT
jgi:hypothetical protein